jgi:lipopolysaccharide exporter
MKAPRKIVNFRGELFTTTFTWAAIAVVRLLSSIILTRILYPEAFGIVTIVASLTFVLEMMSDVGIVGITVRHEKGEDPRFLNTWWTVRLVRSLINASLIFLLAPNLAVWYGEPALEGTLRIYSVWFLIYGCESMAFILSIRRRRTQRMNYIELGCLAVSTAFSIGFSYVLNDHLGIVYAMLINRLLTTIASYWFYGDPRPRLQIHKEAIREQFNFARFVLPSSLITLVVSQFDKLIFLRFFDLTLLGLYGLAMNIAGPLDALVDRLSRNLLYPRCAENFRNSPQGFVKKYYSDSWKLHGLALAPPALLLGVAMLVIEVLYDARYTEAAVMLQFMAVRSIINAFAATSEVLLVAGGLLRIQLVGNAVRLIWLLPAVLLGTHLFGLYCFLGALMLDMAPTVGFYLRMQAQRNMVIWRYEALRIAFVLLMIGIGFLVAAVGRFALRVLGVSF